MRSEPRAVLQRWQQGCAPQWKKSRASRKSWLERTCGGRMKLQQPRETMEKKYADTAQASHVWRTSPAAKMLQTQIAGVTKEAGHCRVPVRCGGWTAGMKLDEDARCCSEIAG
jgi:hypothetical protein